MRKILVSLFLVMTISVPVFVQAQESTEIPPTAEVFETPTALPTETSTPEASATPAPTETAAPPVPPIDQTKVFESIFSFTTVLVVGLVAIFFAVVIGFFRLLSPAVRAILLSGAKTGVDEAGKIAEKTETPIDDLAVSELRKLIARLERELNEVKAQVNQNSSDIAYSARQAGNPPMGTGSHG